MAWKYEAGQKFNRMTLVEQRGSRPCGKWLCRCECGVEKEAMAYDVRRGKVQSCGCLLFEATGEPRLSGAEVLAIRASKESGRKVARQYGCSETGIRKIRARELYRHVQ